MVVAICMTALKVFEQINHKKGIASANSGIGLVYWNQGDYPKALKHYFEALEIDKELGNKNGIAGHLGNIGIVYAVQGDYPNALKHYFEALCDTMHRFSHIFPKVPYITRIAGITA